MKRFVSRPTEIEAVQWNGINTGEVVAFPPVRFQADTLSLLAGVNGAQGYVSVPVGHWIVRNPGDDNDYWPVDPDYFASKYQEAER